VLQICNSAIGMLARTGLISKTFYVWAKSRIRQINTENVKNEQELILKSLVNRAKNTQFGRDHGFIKIRSISEYQERVSVRSYEHFWAEYLKPRFPYASNVLWPGDTKYFAVSSGTTTGKTKYLPVTQALLASNQKAAVDMLAAHMVANPKTLLFSGQNFVLGGSTALVEEGVSGNGSSIWSGDLSGIVAKTVPLWAKPFYFPPPQIALMSNWEEKIGILARQSVKERIVSISGVPSWLIIFFEAVAKQQGCSLAEVGKCFPYLSLLIHGGVNFEPYRKRFKEFLTCTNAELREVYPASEGFVAFQDSDVESGLRLATTHDIFFEFIPLEELNSLNPIRHWVGNIEPNVHYAVVLTTCGGLWSYLLGDTVRFLSVNPPRLLVTGRTSYMLSAFGEHLIGEEIEAAVASAARIAGVSITDFSVGAIYPEHQGELGRHCYVIELDSVTDSCDGRELGRNIDSFLCSTNEDYVAHRAEGFGLGSPEILLVPPGTFANWMKSRGKLGGQNKVPRVINDTILFQALKSFCTEMIDASTALSAHS
jgi:hypothetical protein